MSRPDDDARVRNVHRITLVIVDHDEIGAEACAQLLESANYPNDAISPTVLAWMTREILYTDAHPINKSDPGLVARAVADIFDK